MLCEACERGDHDNCGMQTWCQCDCEGLDQYVPSGCFIQEDLDGERIVPKPDWTYSEGCGCRITFFGASDYKTSRMLPGKECTAHKGQHQVAERDCLVERAKKSLHADYLGR